MAYVTFIIPSIGRYSLRRAMDSVLNQDSPSPVMDMIVAFDGVPPRFHYEKVDESSVTYIELPKQGIPAKARNKILDLGINSDWTAFLDDDDFISNDYGKRLLYFDKKYPDVDIFISSIMFLGQKRVIPKVKDQIFRMDDVGINFCYRNNERTKDLRFRDIDNREDYYFLEDAKTKGLNIYLTHEVNYFVPVPSFRR